jgi:hypothetical protein
VGWAKGRRRKHECHVGSFVSCFCRCLSDGGRADVEPGLLLMMRLHGQAVVQRLFEQSSVKEVKLGGSLASERDNGRLQLGFAFRFLIFQIDAVEISVLQFPGEMQMSPQMIENLFEPALACEFLGADFVLMIDVVSLHLSFVASEPSDD